MFWTALVCGVGGSLGACVGLIAFVFLLEASRKWSGATAAVNNLNERTLAELKIRNEIGAQQTVHLQRIANAIETTGCGCGEPAFGMPETLSVEIGDRTTRACPACGTQVDGR